MIIERHKLETPFVIGSAALFTIMNQNEVASLWKSAASRRAGKIGTGNVFHTMEKIKGKVVVEEQRKSIDELKKE